MGRIYKPYLVRWLSATRTYVYKRIELLVPSGDFHPGLFFHTKLLLRYIGSRPLQDKSLLELGAGNGLISLYAAKKGARVTATDINPEAIEYLEKNSAYNGISLEIIHSDLFGLIPVQAFDIIAINPPDHKRQPATFADYAMFCGEHGEYFEELFRGLRKYTHKGSAIWMVLGDVCDMKMVKRLAKRYGWGLICMYTKKSLLGQNFIFKIEGLKEVKAEGAVTR